MSEREQQLLVKTVQQEEELRRIKKELERLKSSSSGGSSGRRPQTASAGRGGGATSEHTPAPPPAAPPAVVIKKSFDIMLEPPQGNTVPTAVEAHSAIAHEGKVTIFGGTSGPYISSDVWQYSVGGRRWRRPRCEGNAPTGRHGHSAVQHMGKMLIFGGFGPGGVVVRAAAAGGSGGDQQTVTQEGGYWSKSGLLNSLYSFDLRKNLWTEVSTTNTPEPVKSHTAVCFKGRMYVFGGCMPEGRTNVVNALDIETSKWLPTEFLNAQALAAIQAAQQGQSPAANTTASSVTASGGGRNAVAMMSRGDVPAPRSCHTANLFVRNGQGSMIVYGGRLNNSTFCNDVFQYSFENRHWQRLFCGGQIPPPRADHSACLYKEHLVTFGGFYVSPHSKNKHYLADCHVLNVISCTWTRVELIGPQRPLGLFGHTSILYESPEAQICMLSIGGWGVVPEDPSTIRARNSAAAGDDDIPEAAAAAAANEDENSGSPSKSRGPVNTITTTDDVWSFAICNAPPPSQKPASAAGRRPGYSPRRPQTAGVSRHHHSQSPRGRPTSASPRKDGGHSQERNAWRTQTSMASTAKLFGEPPHEPKPPCLRTDYQIDSIVARLRDTRPHEIKQQELTAKYIKEVAAPKLSGEEQGESIDRLFYQQCEWQKEKKKQLEKKWIPRKAPTRVDDATLEDMVHRLGTVPEKKEQEPIPSNKQSKATTEDCVQRLHYFAEEFRKKRTIELENKYLWGAKTKKVNQEQLNGMMDRLVPAPGASSSAKTSRR